MHKGFYLEEYKLWLFVPVMGTALYDFDHTAFDSVNNAVCVVYSAAPISRQIAAQPLWLSDSFIPVSVNIF